MGFACKYQIFFVPLQPEKQINLINYIIFFVMKKIQILLAAFVAACMVSCGGFKVEATVDVTVVKDGQPQKGVNVYRFNDNLGEGTTQYKTNAKDVVTTNDKGVAHFELKSPEDLAPSSVVVDSEKFYFCTYDKDDKRNGIIALEVRSGDKKQVNLEMKDLEKE